MWVGTGEDHVLLNTEVHRQKFLNVERDPRVTVTIWEVGRPYTYIEVRGRVVDTIRGTAARRHIDELSNRYLNVPYPNEVASERVILRVVPERILKHRVASPR